MPKAKLHKEKMPMLADSSSPSEHPTANIPATKEIVQTFAVEDEVIVMLKGKVKSVSVHESEESSHADFTIAVEEVEAYSEVDKTEYEKMADEDEEDE